MLRSSVYGYCVGHVSSSSPVPVPEVPWSVVSLPEPEVDEELLESVVEEELLESVVEEELLWSVVEEELL